MPRTAASTLLILALAACAPRTTTIAFNPGPPPPRSTGLPMAGSPREVGIDPAPLREAEALLRQYVEERRTAGAVAAIARDGRVAWMHAVGVQDLTTGTPMSDRSIFRIYSMTRPIASVAIMMLQEEGRLSLQDPVSRYLPEFANVRVADGTGGGTRPPARPITVEDLLIHTSGLSPRSVPAYQQAEVRLRSDPLPRFIEKIVTVPLMEDPGTRFRYSEGTSVAGRVIEVVSGQPLDRFLQERILGPLGMVDTGFWVTPAQQPRLATVYGPAEGGGLRPVEVEAIPFTERPALLEASVGLVSTVPDLLRFSQMLLNRGELEGVRLLRPETVDGMVGNALPPEILSARGDGVMGWGRGNVNVVMDPSRAPYPANAGEYGWDGTAGTIFWIDPTTRTVIFLMTQNFPANPEMLRQRFKTIVQPAVLPR